MLEACHGLCPVLYFECSVLYSGILSFWQADDVNGVNRRAPVGLTPLQSSTVLLHQVCAHISLDPRD